MPRITESKVKEIDEKIKQLEAQKKQILNKVKEEERRKRTQRLIQIGATMDNAGIDTLEKANYLKELISNNSEIQALLSPILKTDTNGTNANQLDDPEQK